MKNKIFTILFCLMLLFSLTSCIGSFDEPEVEDEEKTLIKEIKEVGSRGYYTIESFTYDEQDRILSDMTTYYEPSGEVQDAYGSVYVYDDENRTYTEHEYLYDSDGNVVAYLQYRIYYLNKSNLAYKSELYRQNDEEEWYIDIICEYDYNEDNKLVWERIKYIEDDSQPINKLSYYVAYKYHYGYENGILKSEAHYDNIDGVFVMGQSIYSYNADKTINQELYYYGPEGSTELYERCDYIYENGQLKETINYYCDDEEDDELDSKEQYSYNELNQLTVKTLFDYINDEELSSTRFTYEYDESGNIIKESRYYYDYEELEYIFDYSTETTYIQK